MVNRGPRVCTLCRAEIAGKVHIFLPTMSSAGSGNVCVDCADKAFEQHLSEERRTQRNTPSFRGMIQYISAHHNKKKIVKKTDIVNALKTGAMTVESLLEAIKEANS